jgi:hypothetical protein
VPLVRRPALIAILLAGLALAGCGDDGEDGASTTGGTAPSTIVTTTAPGTDTATGPPATIATEPAPGDAAAQIDELTAALERFAGLAATDPGDGSGLLGPALLARMERELTAAEGAVANLRASAPGVADEAERSRIEAIAIGGDEAIVAMGSVIANGRAGDPAAAAAAVESFTGRRAELQGFIAGERS